MRLRLFLCFALAAGLGAFALLRKPERKIEATYVRSEGVGPVWTVFAIRNDTENRVTFIAFLPAEAPILYGPPPNGSWEIEPHSTKEVLALWGTAERSHLVNAYVAPWTMGEKLRAQQRYSRFPTRLREWLMRKYDPYLPAYRHEVLLP